jgi:Flp pilus assembly protein TadG
MPRNRTGLAAQMPPGDRDGEAGGVMALVAVLMVGLLAVVGLVYDGGRAITAQRRAINIAEQAARAGARALDATTLRTAAPDRLDPQAAVAEAEAYLASVGATGQVTVTGDLVQVTVAYSEPTRLLGLVGITRYSGTGTADAHSVKGVGSQP